MSYERPKIGRSVWQKVVDEEEEDLMMLQLFSAFLVGGAGLESSDSADSACCASD